MFHGGVLLVSTPHHTWCACSPRVSDSQVREDPWGMFVVHLWYCACVSWAPVKGVQVVKHAIPIANSCPRWHPFHTLGLSSTTPWDSCGWRNTGACSRGFQQAPVSWLLNSVAAAWGLFHNLDSRPLWGLHCKHFERSAEMCLFSFLNMGQLWLGGATLFVSIRVGVLLRRSCHRTLLWCKAGNKKLLPIAYERSNGPVRVVQKHGQECIISRLATRNQVGRHGLYPGHYSGIFVAPRMHETQKPSISQGLYPSLLLALSASTTSTYTSLSVSQESYPRPQLLKASV